MEQELRQMFERKGVDMSVPPTLPYGLRNRIGRQRMIVGGLVAAAAFALVLGGFAVRSAVSTDAAPVPPAEEGKPEIEPMRNGRIVTSVNGMQEWQAFDQDTGLFYFYSYTTERASVIRQDGRVGVFDCPPSADCEFAPTFGPGPDELTVPGDDRSLLVIAFDGTVRHMLDILLPVVTQDQRITDLAWSPDGSRLAISTEPDCDSSSDRCEGNVWIVERDGGEPRLAFTERAPDEIDLEWGPPEFTLGELAWSPDGRSLTLLVASLFPEGYANNGVWPRLVALRLQPGQPVRAETLHVYDDVDMPAWNILGDWPFYFASAWSPDGTRIAVTSQDGIAEISAEGGRILARHRVNPSLAPGAASPGMEGGYGLLAWLPKQ